MTNPARQTARQQIATVAAENGWTATTPTGPAAYDVKFTHGDVKIMVYYTQTGAVRFGDRMAPGQQSQLTGTRRKRETVLAWLREADEQAPEQTATAREQIADVAAEHGWTRAEGNGVDRFRRGDVAVAALYSRAGTVTEAERRIDHGGHVTRDYVRPEQRRKRETVIEWLREGVEQAPAPTLPAVGSELDVAARLAVVKLTQAQRAALAAIGKEGPQPGLVHAARLQVLEAHGLITTQRVGSGRGAWTRADLTGLGYAAFGVMADNLGDEFAVAYAGMVSRELDENRRGVDETTQPAPAGQRSSWSPSPARTAPYRPAPVELAPAVSADEPEREAVTLPCGCPVDLPEGHQEGCSAAQAVRCPHGCGALRWADDAWICPTCGDEWAETPAEQLTAGTYATLAEADAGQPRASVERLRDMATGWVQNAPALARDHARIVLARLDELEAQVAETPMGVGTPYDNLLKDYGQARDRIAELETSLRVLEDAAIEGQDKARARIAELESRQADLLDRTTAEQITAERDNALSRAEVRARDLEDVRASLARAMDRAAELEREHDECGQRIVGLEAEVDERARVLVDAKGVAERLRRERDDERIRGDRLAEQRTELAEQRDQIRVLVGAGQDETTIGAVERLVRERDEARAHLDNVGTTSAAAMIALADQVGYPREESDEDREREATEQGGIPAGTLAWAHIVTSESEALGDPEILIFLDEWFGGRAPIERWKLSDAETDVRDIVDEIVKAGWRAAGREDGWTEVQSGYWIVQVEKI